MPKVVSGKDFDKFVQTGEHQTIDAGKKPTDKPKVEQTPEVKELIAKTEAETAKDLEPSDDKETGLEAGDEDLAERAQQRISKKHREMKQADALAKKLRAELDDTEAFSKSQYQRATAAEEEAAKLRQELEGLRTKAPAEKPGLVAPDVNDVKFKDDKGEFQLKLYEKARDEYVKAQFREELKAEQADAQWQQQVKAFEVRVDQARQSHEDWVEVVGSKTFEVLPYIQRFMVESEQGAEIGYYFAKHPEDYDRIAALHPIRGSAELGKLEAKLADATKKPDVKKDEVIVQKPTGGAPAPIKPLTGGNSGVNTDPAKMSPAELLRYTREREVARKRR